MGKISKNNHHHHHQPSVARFQQGSYTTDILENNYIGASVVKVSATDQDVGINGQLSYYIESSYQDSNLVSMDRDTGLVMAKAPLDYEKIKQLKFNVVAVDHGFKPRTG